jgi:cytochrome c2
MKKFFRISLRIVGVLAVAIGGLVAYFQIKGIPTYRDLASQIPKDYKVTVTPERVQKGMKIASMLCNDCHTSNDEQRLSGKRVLDIPKDFGTAYSLNLTNDPEKGIGKWTDGELAYFIRTGVRADGSFAPAYMPKFPIMSEEDLQSVISFLRSDNLLVQASKLEPPFSEPSLLTKVLTNTVMKPYPFDAAPAQAPPVTNQVLHGKYLADAVYGCTNCHSADFKSNNELDPPSNKGYCGGGNKLLDLDGNTILAANITFDNETGLGSWSEDDFITCVKYGKRKNGEPLRYPMTPRSGLDSTEVKAIYAYLKSIPTIKNPVDRGVKKAGM